MLGIDSELTRTQFFAVGCHELNDQSIIQLNMELDLVRVVLEIEIRGFPGSLHLLKRRGRGNEILPALTASPRPFHSFADDEDGLHTPHHQ